MKFSSTLRNLRTKYIHTNSVGFEYSTCLLIASLREKTITQVVTSCGFSISKMVDEYCLCLSLPFSISETKHVIKKLTTHVSVTLEVLINKSIKKYIAVALQDLFVSISILQCRYCLFIIFSIQN